MWKLIYGLTTIKEGEEAPREKPKKRKEHKPPTTQPKEEKKTKPRCTK